MRGDGHKWAEAHDGRQPHESANDRLLTVRACGLATDQRPRPQKGGCDDVCRFGALKAGRTSQRRRDYNRSTTLRRVPMDSWAGGELEKWPWGEWADAESNQSARGSVQATDASRCMEVSCGWITSSSGRTGRTVAPVGPQDRVETGPHRGPRGVVPRAEGTVLATADALEVEALEEASARD